MNEAVRRQLESEVDALHEQLGESLGRVMFQNRQYLDADVAAKRWKRRPLLERFWFHVTLRWGWLRRRLALLVYPEMRDLEREGWDD